MTCLMVIKCILVFAAALHRTECMVYHLTLLSRNINDSLLQGNVGEIHYQGDASGSQMINEVGCVWQPITSTGDINKMSLPKNECLPLLPTGISRAATGFKVETNNDLSLHVYQSNDEGDLADGYLAIPDDKLGREYYVITYCSTGGYCQFAVTGTDDSTSINVVFPLTISPGSITCNGTSISTGEPLSFVLNENEVLHFESTRNKTDLSGTYITSDKNVAVFVGARDVPGKSGKSAFMIEQIPPVTKWGTEHVVAPNILNDAGDIVKIITKSPDTTIQILRFSPFTISNSGEAIERRIDWKLFSTIIANKPILVIQVMSLDLYNNTSIVQGNPAMVLVPHVEQWTNRTLLTDCLQKARNESVLTMTAKTSDSASFAWEPATNSQFTSWTSIDASDYSTLVVRTNAPESEERQSFGGHFRALHGYCGGAFAVLYDIDWEWENEECVRTSPVPGDGVDNDCDGKVDEDNCTQTDLAIKFTSVQDPITFKTTYKSINVKKASPVKFSVKSCGIAKMILQTTVDSSLVTTTMQITTSSVILQTCSPKCTELYIIPNSVSNCEQEQNYEISWYEMTSSIGTEHVFTKTDTDETHNYTIAQTVDYDVLFLTSFVKPAEFIIDLPDKDCGKVKSGDEADNHGTKFLVPLQNSIDYTVYLTNPYESITQVIFRKASDKTVLSNVDVQPSSTVTKSNTDLANEEVIIVESDSDISVYATRTSNSRRNIGFSILPADILGPNYHVYLDKSFEAASTPAEAQLCKGYSFTDNTVSNIGPVLVGSFIPLTKGIYDSDIGHRKRITANRPFAFFCGAADKLVQIPPLETLGTHYFIPPLPYSKDSEEAEIRLVATEDSTVVIIRGNYDNLDTIEMTGNIHFRTIEPNLVYNITSTKPIQVHILFRSLATSSSWASVTAIPPVKQYKTKHVFPTGFSGIITAVEIDGTPLQVQLVSPSQNVNRVYNRKTFPLFIINRSDGGKYVIAGDALYEDINKVCRVTEGSPGDGKDNDCDGLIDEEHCTTDVMPGNIDADIDGSLNEDCANGTTPLFASTIDLPLTPQFVTCPTNTGAGGNSDATGNSNNEPSGNVNNNTITIDNGYMKRGPPSEKPNINSAGSPPSYKPISASAVGVSVQGLSTTTPESTVANATKKDTCVADCVCPCGWVNPPRNYTPKELEAVVTEIQEKLRVTKTSLSSVIRSKSSARDDRTEAAAVGIAGVVFIVVVLGAIILLDLATITRDLRLMVGNLRQVFQP